MTTAIENAPADITPRAWVQWVGRGLSALPVGMLLFSATLKLSRAPMFLDIWVNKFGYPDALAQRIGVLEIACALLYAIPRTSVLGAIVVTGYLGGAVATHVRVGDPFITPLALGILAWVGLYLREPRLRALAPRRT